MDPQKDSWAYSKVLAIPSDKIELFALNIMCSWDLPRVVACF